MRNSKLQLNVNEIKVILVGWGKQFRVCIHCTTLVGYSSLQISSDPGFWVDAKLPQSSICVTLAIVINWLGDSVPSSKSGLCQVHDIASNELPTGLWLTSSQACQGIEGLITGNNSQACWFRVGSVASVSHLHVLECKGKFHPFWEVQHFQIQNPTQMLLCGYVVSQKTFSITDKNGSVKHQK